MCLEAARERRQFQETQRKCSLSLLFSKGAAWIYCNSRTSWNFWLSQSSIWPLAQEATALNQFFSGGTSSLPCIQ